MAWLFYSSTQTVWLQMISLIGLLKRSTFTLISSFSFSSKEALIRAFSLTISPPKISILPWFSILNTEGHSPNIVLIPFLLKLISFHSSLSREQISQGAALWSSKLMILWPSGTYLVIPPNFRMNLSLQVVRECRELLLLRESMMQMLQLLLGTSFQHLAKQPSESFSPPMIQISPLSWQTPKNRRSVFISLICLKEGSSENYDLFLDSSLLQSHFTIALEEALPSPKMKQQFLVSEKID